MRNRVSPEHRITSGTAVTTGQHVAALTGHGIDTEGARARIDRDRGRLVTLTHEGRSVIPTFQLRVSIVR